SDVQWAGRRGRKAPDIGSLAGTGGEPVHAHAIVQPERFRPRPTRRPSGLRPWAASAAATGTGSAVVVLSIAELPFGQLAPLLRFDAQRRDRTRLEPSETDLVARLLAVPVGLVVDPLQRRVDLFQQLALAIARPQLEAELGLLRRAVVR